MSKELTLTIKGFTDEDQVRAFCGWYCKKIEDTEKGVVMTVESD